MSSKAKAIALTALCAAGCAAPVEGLRVGRVEIVGNEQVSARALAGGLATRGPTGLLRRTHTEYDPLAVDADVERIRAFYHRRGYFGAAVTDVEVSRTDERTVVVRFEVREGEPTRIAAVSIGGAPAEAVEPLRPGEVFDHASYLEVKTRLRRELVSRGHLHAVVAGEVRVDRDRRVAEVELRVEPGPLVRFGRTRVVGLERLPESFVLARLDWDPGDVVTPPRIEATQGRLYRLGWFRAVNVEIERDGVPEVVDVVVRVEEAARREVRLGGGLAADDARWELSARAGYTLHGFLDPRTQLGLDAIPAYAVVRGEAADRRGIGGEARVELSRHDLLLPRLRGDARVAYRQVELEAYGVRGPLARLAVGRPLHRDALHLAFGWEGRNLNFYDPHPALVDQLAGTHRLMYLDQSISYDRRDDILDPHRGYYLELRLEEGRYRAGGGDGATYVKGLAEARGYLSLRPRLVGAARLRYGRALAGDLPIPQRLYSGGASHHRGFPARRLAPFVEAPDAPTVPIGGDSLLDGSVEVRADLLRVRGRLAGVVLFADLGDVVPAGAEIDPLDLHWAVGGGLRYDTLVGPIRLDVGYRVTRFGAGEPDAGSRISLHLSVGEAF